MLEWDNNKVKKYLKTKKYIALPFLKLMIGNAVSHYDLSFYPSKVKIVAAIQTFLNNIGFHLLVINKRVTEVCTPSRSAIADYVYEPAAEKLA